MRAPVLHSILAGVLALAAWGSTPLALDAGTAVCEPTCEDRCRAHSQDLYSTCVDAGGDPAPCAERARAALSACVQENCRPDPTCEELCRARAGEFLRNCVASGEDPEACAERARSILTVCIEERCTPVPTCRERCRARAEELRRACVATGGDATLCAERARLALEACVRDNCDLCTCPDVRDPVCGADGKTYRNACEARCAGVAVDHPGECRVACRCNADCADGNVCLDGACRPPCNLQCFAYTPVCGTDGRTYGCGGAEAACNGVAVLHQGECGRVCRADADCPAGALCTAPRDCPDACGCASFCQACPCPRIFDPVCGTDGRTYPNACLARCAHVDVAYRGACRSVTRSR
jgi:hypothetical protein